MLALALDGQAEVLESYLCRLVRSLRSPARRCSGSGAIAQRFGLDSLARLELLVCCENALGVTLDPERFDSGITVRGFARSLASDLASVHRVGPSASIARAEPADPGDSPVPLSPAQLDYLRPGLPAPTGFVVDVFLRTPVDLDVAALETALASIAARHDVFGFRFVSGHDGWRQIVDATHGRLAFHRLSALGLDAEATRALAKTQQAEVLAGMDLARGPLARALLIERSPGQPGLLRLVIHHLIADETSVRILAVELDAAYRRACRGLPPLDEPSPNSFERFTRSLAAAAGSPALDAEVGYWQDICRPYQAVALACDGDSKGSANAPADVLGSLDDPTTATLLRRFPDARSRHGLLLAASLQAWCRATQRTDAFVRLDHHGRQAVAGFPAPTSTVGYLVSYFPFRMEADSTWDAKRWLAEVRENLERVPGGGRGFGRLRYASEYSSRKGSRDGARLGHALENPAMPQLSFSFRPRAEDTFRADMALPVVHATSRVDEASSHARSAVDVQVLSGITDGQLHWTLRARPGLSCPEFLSKLSLGMGEFLSAL
ncbi:MAG: condensation domain-containing protein [Rubrivivax sp.]